MRNKLVNDIIYILNNDSSLSAKQDQIRALYKNRRKENKNLLHAVCSILSNHILPIRYNETISSYYTENSSEGNYIQLAEIVQKSKCNYFNAICNEILWNKNHVIDCAKQSIFAYNKELSQPSIPVDHKYTYTYFSVGICRIYSRCKVPEFDFEFFFNNTITYIKNNYDKQGYFILSILEALWKCKEHLDIIEITYLEAVDYFETKVNYEKVCSYLESLIEFYTANNNNSKIKDIRIKIAINLEKQANQLDWKKPNDSHRIIHLIQKSMEYWGKVQAPQSNQERKRLAKRIEPVKELLLKSMQSITSGPIDFSAFINNITEFLSNSTIEAIIYRLANIIPLKSLGEMKSKIQNSSDVFSTFFPITKLDPKGRVRCIIPSAMDAEENEMIQISEHKATEEYRFVADAFIKRYLWIAKDNNIAFTKENLKFLVENNAFIPPDRQETYLNGLIAGFNLDLPTAMHLLMPQIENSLRIIAEDCGAVVYKTYANGVEECLSLNSILNLPEVTNTFDENFLFNLKLFYISEYGFGMRDNICHSLCSDRELQTATALSVWWFTLHICCMYSPQLIKRLIDQNNAQ